LALLAEKINRVGRVHISPEMTLVTPRSIKALDFRPFPDEISEESFEEYRKKRDELVEKY
jgi:hypothetical protein